MKQLKQENGADYHLFTGTHAATFLPLVRSAVVLVDRLLPLRITSEGCTWSVLALDCAFLSCVQASMPTWNAAIHATIHASINEKINETISETNSAKLET